MMNRQMLVVAVIFGMLLCGGVAWAGPPLNVSVTLEGPDEGFADEPLEYLASGGFDLDGPTQTEVTNGEATVEEEYAWSYAPASCDTAPATGPEETFRFAPEYAPGEYTITVTYTVTVRYKDGTSDQDFAVDDILVKIKTVEIAIDVADEDGHICAGGKQSARHQTLVTATVTNALGQPVVGKTVDFSADHAYVEVGPSFQPASPVTNDQGIATTMLTSGDGIVGGQVEVECEGSTAQETVYFDKPTATWSIVDPITEEPIEYLLANGETQCKVIVHLTHDGADVEGHHFEWYFKFWKGDRDRWTQEANYSGTAESPYGSIAPTEPTVTDEDGLTHSIYTIGTIGGWINFHIRMVDIYFMQ